MIEEDADDDARAADFRFAHLDRPDEEGESEVETPNRWRVMTVRLEFMSVATAEGDDDKMLSRCLSRCA